MVRALNTAATGMDAQQTLIDIIANNLANVNTAGFKRGRGEFQDLYYQQIRAATEAGVGTASPIGLEVGQGVRVMASQKIFTPGEMQETGGMLDVAIEGRGFLKVTTPDGQGVYSRAGQLRVNEQGQMVNMDGYLLDPPTSIPTDATEINISREGLVQYKRAGEEAFSPAGQLNLTTFPNPAGLKSLGRGLFGATVASGSAFEGTPGQNGVGAIQQGSLESSNVKVVEEMIGLISAQRAYEINSKVVQATDQMLKEASSIR
jgi:flagellar basal-body rod protein FlgG